MTNERAIEILKRMQEPEAWEPAITPEAFEALQMACTALKRSENQNSSEEPEDCTEMKRDFLRMASYIDVLLECSDEQKETLMGFISRLAEFMPWTERD